MNVAHVALGALLLTLVPVVAAQSGQHTLSGMSTYDSWLRGRSVRAVAVAPQKLETPYFSAESLRSALPNLWPALIRANWCEGKEKQRGVVVLTNGEVVFWHSCAASLISFDGEAYPGSFTFKE